MLRRRVAVKVLHESREHDTEIIDRFLIEAVATARVCHPGVLHVYDYGHDYHGRTYLITELLIGQTLAQRLAHGRISMAISLEIGRQLAETLSAAHAVGVIHRDLKPENIYLVADPQMPYGVRVKILDFGLAKLLRDQVLDPNYTRVGRVLGTPLYMPPEQWLQSHAVDHRADIYAIGCILYEMLCGQVPYPTRAESLGGVGPVPMLALSPLIPPRIEQLVLQMIALRPDDRPASMFDVAQVLAPRLTVAQIAAAPTGRHEPTVDRFAEGTRSEADARPRPVVVPPVQRARRRAITPLLVAAALAFGIGAGLAIGQLL
jgi:eukaryotic-like serine/threonine-protein kinase